MKKMIDNPRIFGTIICFAVLFLLLSSMIVPFSAKSEENSKAEVPEWKKGDEWEYKLREPYPGGMTAITKLQKEVTKEKVEINVDEVEGGGETYKAYETTEKRLIRNQSSDPDGENVTEVTGKYHYTKDHLSPIYNHPEGKVASFYYPPIKEMNFPLKVGKNWSSTEGWYFENRDPPVEPSMEIVKYQGRVEEKITKEVEAGEFEVFKINMTILGNKLEDDELQLKRYEIFYSPEVKNIIHREMYQTKRLPPDYQIGDKVLYENSVGNETLLSYNLEPRDDDNSNQSPFLGAGPLFFAIVGTSIFYFYKNGRKGKN